MAAKEMSIEHGEILFLHEVGFQYQHQQGQQGQHRKPQSVRVLGQCVDVNPLQKRLAILDRGASLVVDIELVADQQFALEGLYQFIGELLQEKDEEQQGASGQGGPRLVLRARVARAVEGMDVSLYEQAVRLRRAFLEKNK